MLVLSSIVMLITANRSRLGPCAHGETPLCVPEVCQLLLPAFQGWGHGQSASNGAQELGIISWATLQWTLNRGPQIVLSTNVSFTLNQASVSRLLPG